MSKKILIAISALVVAGCFFGGESDTATIVKDDPKVEDTLPKTVKLLEPGIYLANYDWIDSNRQGLESELLLNSAGTFSHYYVFENEATFETRGNWHQKDSSIVFAQMEETQVNRGLFDEFETVVEDDTNSIAILSGTSFARREYTPFRQKPYWITYNRKTYPKLKDGIYLLQKIDSSDSQPVPVKFRIALKNEGYVYTFTQDTVETYQASARFSQIGSFLAIDSIQDRQVDSTNTFVEDWRKVPGVNLTRMQVVNDSVFNLWTPPPGFLVPGTWDPYSKTNTD